MSPTASTDLPAYKEGVRAQWNQSAKGWNDHTAQIHSWLRQATEAMLDGAAIGHNSRVLDIAAGAGDQTLDIAERTGPQGLVLATDLSPAILALAQANAARAGYSQVQTLTADGENLPLEPASFDAAVCRLGLMFFPDPLKGLQEMHRVLRPGGAVSTLVFSRPDKNPCIGMLMATAFKHAGLAPRDPYQPGGLLSLGKPGLIDELFRNAGFKDVVTTALDAPFRLPSVKHYLEFVRSSASPIQQILSRLDAAATQAAWNEMEERLSAFSTSDGWVGPNELLLTTARCQ